MSELKCSENILPAHGWLLSTLHRNSVGTHRVFPRLLCSHWGEHSSSKAPLVCRHHGLDGQCASQRAHRKRQRGDKKTSEQAEAQPQSHKMTYENWRWEPFGSHRRSTPCCGRAGLYAMPCIAHKVICGCKRWMSGVKVFWQNLYSNLVELLFDWLLPSLTVEKSHKNCSINFLGPPLGWGLGMLRVFPYVFMWATFLTVVILGQPSSLTLKFQAPEGGV